MAKPNPALKPDLDHIDRYEPSVYVKMILPSSSEMIVSVYPDAEIYDTAQSLTSGQPQK